MGRRKKAARTEEGTEDMWEISIAQGVWIIVLGLQFLTIIESAFFMEEHEGWCYRRKRRSRSVQDKNESADVGDVREFYNRYGFGRDDILILNQISPSIVKVGRSILVAIGEVGWPIIVMIVWIMELAKLDKGLPVPYEYLGILEIVAAIPYAKMCCDFVKEYQGGKNRKMRLILMASFGWVSITSFNAYFGWTMGLRESRMFLGFYGGFQIVNLSTRLIASARHLKRVREMQLWIERLKNVEDGSGNEEDEQKHWHLRGDGEEYTQLVFDCILMLCWFVDSTDYDKSASAVIDVIASASYFLVVRSYDIWWEGLCEDLVNLREEHGYEDTKEVGISV